MGKLRAPLVVALLLLLVWVPRLGTQGAVLRVHFVDVGHGDGVLIQSPSGQNVVYDAGADPDRMRDYLTSLGISKVGLAIASHNHADHIGGLPELVRRFRPTFYMDNGVPNNTMPSYASLLETVAQAGSQRVEATGGRILLGDASLVVLPPPRIPGWDQADNSIGLIVEYAGFRLSLTGDAEQREWSWWLTHHRDLFAPVQVHKSSSHGSSAGDTANGIAQLAPKTVAVSVGASNSYGYPDPQTLRLYGDSGAAVYRTDLNGTIIVEVEPSGAYAVKAERGEAAQLPPAVPTPSGTPNVVIQSISATTERETNGRLTYPVTFQVRESGGMAVSLSAISMAMTLLGNSDGGLTASPAEVFGTEALPARGSLTSRTLRLRSDTSVQATEIAIRVAWAAGTNSGMAQASANITPAPCIPVGIPRDVRVSVAETTVTFSWSAATGSPTDYLIEIGTSLLARDVDTKTVEGTSFAWSKVPAGEYFARVRARNACGAGAPSLDVTFRVVE